MTPHDDRLLYIARGVAANNLGMFSAFRQFDIHDLTMHGYLAMRGAAFNPGRGAPGPFFAKVARRSLIDLWRHSRRERDRESARAISHDGISAPLPRHAMAHPLRRVQGRALAG